MVKKIDWKNAKWWEWLIIALVGMFIFFPKTIVRWFAMVAIEEGSVPVQGKKKGGFLRFLKSVALGILEEMPFGGVINGILNGVTGGQWNSRNSDVSQ